ncbi:hypothetical protein Saso_44500 [Streptomyces asoensis]|uniref:Uncharacterized protein n=1 Tax=Streptomyces asoensis TaxID=249586 RepID=A0ABQ3S3V1_9ACTN|nr:hypothetical protein GCM10010496_51430 [Streptomyces asoensis]GHI62800.1 hypothetical protein Saso_44500 [Streptomyces asoensis]
MDAGIVTESWYAEFAFRRRVNMSAIGSVMVMNWPVASLAGVSWCAIPLPDPRRDGCGAVDLRRSKSYGRLSGAQPSKPKPWRGGRLTRPLLTESLWNP